MVAKSVIPAMLLFLCSSAIGQTIHRSPEVPRLMGREVVITDPETEADGRVLKGSASICVEGPPQRQCYTAPDQYGHGQTELVEAEKDVQALFFRAEADRTSGFSTHFALLKPGDQTNLDNLFFSDIELSNLSEHAFWSDSVVSAAKIFVTAEYVLGPDESHYSDHRYMISAYVLKHTSVLLDEPMYYLEDQYLTARSYDNEKAHILMTEKPEIIGRLRRLKAGRKAVGPAPHPAPAH